MTRRLDDGESYVGSYGLESDTGAMTLREKSELITRRGERRRIPVPALVATDAIVSSDLVARYREDREWESRPIEVTARGPEYLVLDGHHRAAAASAEGAGSVPAVVL